MDMSVKLVLFLLTTLGLTWVSRASLRRVRHHGFYRYFAWEAILIMFLLNVSDWFRNPFSLGQIISWIMLSASLALILLGIRQLRTAGGEGQARPDPALLGIEKTTALVTEGIYCYIRHPFYSSLLCLCWGILLKKVSLAGVSLAVITSLLLVLTAKMEEVEDIQYFGEQYRRYMQHTKMFVPLLF